VTRIVCDVALDVSAVRRLEDASGASVRVLPPHDNSRWLLDDELLSDTEVLLRSYLQWGAGCLPRVTALLRGLQIQRHKDFQQGRRGLDSGAPEDTRKPLLIQPRLGGRHLQAGLASHGVDGGGERRENAGIGDSDGEKHRYPEPHSLP